MRELITAGTLGEDQSLWLPSARADRWRKAAAFSVRWLGRCAGVQLLSGLFSGLPYLAGS